MEESNSLKKPDLPSIQGAVCPVPLQHKQQIVMGHGSGGKMTHDLVAKAFLPALESAALRAGDDAGLVTVPAGGELARLSISTDSHVVWPLFFPGGNIGRLAICGTVNDVAMLGAKPLYLTAGFILEEGLDLEVLERVVASMRQAAEEAGVQIIAGDTKVVQKGKADGMYITSTGVGVLPAGIDISGNNARPGDVVIVSGTIGDHGIAVLGARGELGFEADVRSDVAPLNHLIAAMLEAAREEDGSSAIHVLRDPTRGGVATTLNEIAKQSGVCITIQEAAIPVRPPVQAACEMLGFDPLYIANEGKLLAFVRPDKAQNVLACMHQSLYGEEAVIIGEVQPTPKNRVLMRTTLGSTRVVDVLSGEMLPRIC